MKVIQCTNNDLYCFECPDRERCQHYEDKTEKEELKEVKDGS